MRFNRSESVKPHASGFLLSSGWVRVERLDPVLGCQWQTCTLGPCALYASKAWNRWVSRFILLHGRLQSSCLESWALHLHCVVGRLLQSSCLSRQIVPWCRRPNEARRRCASPALLSRVERATAFGTRKRQKRSSKDVIFYI